jgi:hypothetical protein
MMRVAVVGGDGLKVVAALSDLDSMLPLTAILHGGACRSAAGWGYAAGVEVLEYLPDRAKHGRAAGMRRNDALIEYGRPDLVLVFPGGDRADADDLAARARAAGIEVVDY